MRVNTDNAVIATARAVARAKHAYRQRAILDAYERTAKPQTEVCEKCKAPGASRWNDGTTLHLSCKVLGPAAAAPPQQSRLRFGKGKKA